MLVASSDKQDIHSYEILKPMCFGEGKFKESLLYPKNLAPKKRSLLHESYGIKDYNEKYFNNNLKEFVHKNIVPVIKNPNPIYDVSIPGVLGGRNAYKILKFDVNLSWVDFVFVLVTKESSTESSGELARLYYSDTKYDDYDFVYNGRKHKSYSLEGTHINYMTVFIDLRGYTIFDENEICGIIHHEMNHGYDLIKDKFVSNYSNRDVIYFSEKSNDNPIKYITKYWEYDGNERRQFIIEKNSREIFLLISDMVYYLNMSEMHARLANFAYEMDDLKKHEEISRYFGIETLVVYFGMMNILQGLIEYASDDAKWAFANKHAREFEMVYSDDRKEDDEPTRKNVSFKVYGKYNKTSFDYIMQFYLRRINRHFIRNAKKIYMDKGGYKNMTFDKFVKIILDRY